MGGPSTAETIASKPALAGMAVILERLERLRAALTRQTRTVLRIAVQTAVAVAATYGVATWLGLDQMSWAVISALFSIGLSPDRSYANALGRVGGATLGVLLGIGAVLAPGGTVLVALVLATTLANVVAALKPNLRYVAVTAAVVTLNGGNGLAADSELVTAILTGSILGALSTMLIWPAPERSRARDALGAALADCKEFLELIGAGVGSDDHRQRDAVRARFLGHLGSARTRLEQTRFRPSLPSGAPLRAGVAAVDALWYALVTLDRAVSDERRAIRPAARQRLRQALSTMADAADGFLDAIVGQMEGDERTAPSTEALDAAVEDARRALAAARQDARDARAETRALDALEFALDETAQQLQALLHLGRQSA